MKKKLIVVTTILLGAVLLSACAGGPIHGTTWPGLATDGNMAYLADGPFVYAVSLGDGREIWRYPGERNNKIVFYSPPAITPDGLIIVGSAGTDHSLIALSPNDINPDTNAPFEEWKFTGAKDHWVAAPLVVENKLFAVNSDGNLYIIDLEDGRSVKEATVVELGGRLWSQPTTDGERVYITSLDHSVIAVDANTFKVLWHEELGGAVPGSAVLSGDGSLYVGSLDSKLEKFDPASGDHQSIVDAENWVWSTPSLDGDTLYFGDVDGNVYSLNTSTGSLGGSPSGWPITASPLVGRTYPCHRPGSIFAVDRDGKGLGEAVAEDLYNAHRRRRLDHRCSLNGVLPAALVERRQVWTFTRELEEPCGISLFQFLSMC
jgi:outer membrane protein assembly factor BamB